MPAKTLQVQIDGQLIKTCDRVIEFLLNLTFFSIPLFFVILTRDQFELPKLTILRLLTIGMLATWAVRIVAARRFEWRRTPLDLPIAVWVGLQVVTTLVSVSIPVSLLGEYENFRGLFTVLNYIVLYYLVVHFIHTRDQINRLLFVALLSGLLVMAYGVSQFFGLDFIAWNPTSIAAGRYFSSLGNPNFLAAYLAMLMPFIIVFFVESRSAFRRLLLFISFVGMFFALMGTWSRGGFLGLVGALLVLAALGLAEVFRRFRADAENEHLAWPDAARRALGRHISWVVMLVLSLALLIVISTTFGRHHMVRVASSIVHLPETLKVSRLHIWKPALDIIRSHPVLGTGLDTFKTVFPRYATPDFALIDGANVASRTAHNEVLQVLATQGWVGLIIVAWLTWVILRVWRNAYLASASRWQDRLVLAGLLAGWAAYSIQNVFSFGVAAIDTLYWLFIALMVLLTYSPEALAQQALSAVPEESPRGLPAAASRRRTWSFLAIALVAGGLSWQTAKVAIADFLYNRGSYERMAGLTDQVISDFAAASRLMPWEVKYAVYEGLAYEEKAKTQTDPAQQLEWLKKAITAYLRGERLNPTNAYYLGNLGRAYGFASQIDKANDTYYRQAVAYSRRAVTQAPVTVLFYQALCMTYLSRSDHAECSRTIAQLAAFAPQEAAKLAYSAGNAVYGSMDLAQAQRYYEDAVRYDPSYAEVYYNLGVIAMQTRHMPEAIQDWQKAAQLKPDFEPARSMLKRYGAGTLAVQ